MGRKHTTAGARRWGRRAAIKILVVAVTAATSQGISPSLAMPPHPALAARIQRGDVVVPLTDRDFGPTDPAQDPGRGRNIVQLAATASAPFRTLAILIEYSDSSAHTDAAEFDTLLYETNRGTVRDYYLEVSYGQIDLVTVELPSTTGWQTAPETRRYYSDSAYGLSAYPRNAQKLVQDAIAAADPWVDFSQYDNDGDNKVDALMIVHAGRGAELTGDVDDIWSHKWGIPTEVHDGVQVSRYAMMPEFWISPGDMTIGVFAHELGHVFGLPDLYDTDNSSRGVGRWSLMSNGSWNGSLGNSPSHPDAWCRIQLGFAAPVAPSGLVLDAPFPRVETDPVIYRLWDGGASGDEYFLVENRQKVGFDAYLPGSGLLVWHIDDTVTTDNDNEWYPGHTGSGHYLVALEQADGAWGLEKNTSYGDASDPFPGATGLRSFNSTTTPSSLAYDGSVSLVIIDDISDSDSLMTADLTISLITGIDDQGTRPEATGLVKNFPNPFNAGTRIEASLPTAGPARAEIYNVLGHRVRALRAAFVNAGVWTVDWDGRDSGGREQGSGVYWYRVTARGFAETGKMVMLK